MKKILILIAFTITFSNFAQQGINYKAIIKDGSGNVLSSTPINIQFIIYEGAALSNNVYQESHTVNTDAYGIVIVNIGEGATSDVFANINWGADQHFLNVQVNTGTGLIDMGTTEFMAVPYAKHAETAANVSGLEKITEGGNTGWRLIGQDSNNYGDIGSNAMDLSISNGTPITNGATGKNSFAIGFNTTASRFYSTAMGYQTIASGYYSTAMGLGTKAEAIFSTAIGKYNIGGGDYFNRYPTNPLFEIGNGTNGAPSNALTVFVGTDASLTSNSGIMMIGNNTGPNIVFDTNEFMARNNGSISPLYLQNDGGDLIINSANNGNVGIGTSAPSSKLDVNGVLRAQNNVWPTTGEGIEIAYDPNFAHNCFLGNCSYGAGYVQAYNRDTAEWNPLFLGASRVLPVIDNFAYLGYPDKRWIKVFAVNGTIETSDRRLKKEIKNLNYGLNTVMQLRPVSYKWKKGSQDVNLGLIAQEVQKLIPEVIDVGTDKAKTLGMKYTELIPVLIKGMQEQQKTIENQQKEIVELKKMVNKLLDKKLLASN